MTSSLPLFWSQLTDTVHPEDQPVFDRFPAHGFNLDYPPPAFIGDVVNAPVLILDNNGGYDDEMTPREFSDQSAQNAFRERLNSSRPAEFGLPGASPYYHSRNFSEWLATGKAALVNGVAYRSVDGQQHHVARLTTELPSARFHRNWLIDEILPEVLLGQRFVVVHRWKRWKTSVESLRKTQFAVFSDAPIRPDLTVKEWNAAAKFLADQGIR